MTHSMGASPHKRRYGVIGRKKVQEAKRRGAKNKVSPRRPVSPKKRARKSQKKSRASLSDLIKVMTEVRVAVLELRDFFVRKDNGRASRVTVEDSRREPEPVSSLDTAIRQQTNEPHDASRTDGNSSSNEQIIANTYEKVASASLRQRKYSHLAILQYFYRKSQEANEAGVAEPALTPKETLAALAGEALSETMNGTESLTREYSHHSTPRSDHVIGKILHDLRAKDCLEPGAPPIELTPSMEAIGRKKAPVRSWKLTALGKSVVEYERESRRQGSSGE